MRILGFFATILLLGTVGAWLMGWLFFPIISFIAAFFWRPTWAWLTGFLSGAFSWALMAAAVDSYTHGIMGGKIAALFSMEAHSGLALLITGMVGGLACSFPAVSGKALWKWREEQKQKWRYGRRPAGPMGRVAGR